MNLKFQVSDLTGNVIESVDVPITGNQTRDVRSYTPPPDLPPGRYVIGYVFSEVAGVEATATVVFDYATALANRLTETVFHDRNGNAVRDSGEEGIENWLVRMINPNGNAVQVLTDGQGMRSDANVPAGQWTISSPNDPVAAGWLPTTPTSSVINVPAGGTAEWEMGLTRPAAISGGVFIDGNANGVRDVGEVSYTGGAPLSITGTTNTGAGAGATLSSDGTDGTYRFGDLVPGTYGVTITPPQGYFLTSPPTLGNIGLVSGAESSNNNFGLVPAGNLSLGAFHDRNMDGVRGAGEEGVPSWTFSRSGPGGGTATSDTGANGTVAHPGVRPGTWLISGETPVPSEWISTTTTSGSVNVPQGGSGSFDLGLVKPVQVCGTVFIDANQNGRIDAGESVKSGASVALSGTDLSGAGQSITGTSDGRGDYCFSVPPGTYQVEITTPGGFTLTTPQSYTGIGVAPGGVSDDNDFGLFSPDPTGTLVINAFHDRNMNGTQQGNEEGVANWAFTKSGPSGTGQASVASPSRSVTGPGGLVAHPYLLAGPWVVRSGEQPSASGWIGTTVTSGAVNVPENGVGRFDLGIVRPVKVCGTVFIDANKNKKFDSNESTESGVRLDLSGRSLAGTTLSETVNSGPNGTYCFVAPPGDYQVRVSRPGGFTLTTVQVRSGISPAAGGTSDGNDFGLAPPPPALSPEGPAKLKVVKSGPAKIKRGKIFTFKVVVTNTSRNRARNVVVVDPIPDTLTLATRPAKASVVNGIVTWKLGTILAGKSKTRTFRARVTPGLRVGRVRNVATATADGVPPVSDSHAVRLIDPPPAPRTGGVAG